MSQWDEDLNPAPTLHGAPVDEDSTGMLIHQQPSYDIGELAGFHTDVHPQIGEFDGDMPLNLGVTVQSL